MIKKTLIYALPIVMLITTGCHFKSAAPDEVDEVPNVPAAQCSTGLLDLNTLSGLKLWMKADSVIGLSEGAEVIQWTDSSANAHVAAKSTTGNGYFSGPAFIPNAVSGCAALRFDRSSTHTRGPTELHLPDNSVFTSIANYNVFTVIKMNNFTGYNSNYQTILGFSSNGDNPLWGFRNGNVNYYDSNLNGASEFISTDVLGFSQFVIVEYYKSGTTIGVKINGVASGSDVLESKDWARPVGFENDPSVSTINNSTRNIGGDGSSNGGEHLNADLAEIAVFDNVLSEGDSQQVYSYLRTKYGLSQ